MPITMPASIPTSKITALMRIIIDPIIIASFGCPMGIVKPPGGAEAHALSPPL